MRSSTGKGGGGGILQQSSHLHNVNPLVRGSGPSSRRIPANKGSADSSGSGSGRLSPNLQDENVKLKENDKVSLGGGIEGIGDIGGDSQDAAHMPPKRKNSLLAALATRRPPPPRRIKKTSS